MPLKKKLLLGAVVIAIAAASAGLGAVAATTYGTRSDPLVTLSYLDETVMPRIREEVGGILDDKVEALESELEKLVTNSGAASGGARVDGDLRFSLVSLSSGQTLTCSVGTEIMLRIGTAETYGPSSPRLIDETSGSAVSEAGTELTKNHMYVVTIANNGIKATSNVKVIVRGTYKIS